LRDATILSIPARIMATYWSAMQPDGSLYCETVGPSPTIMPVISVVVSNFGKPSDGSIRCPVTLPWNSPIFSPSMTPSLAQLEFKEVGIRAYRRPPIKFGSSRLNATTSSSASESAPSLM
jgi:hypothetical protein